MCLDFLLNHHQDNKSSIIELSTECNNIIIQRWNLTNIRIINFQ